MVFGALPATDKKKIARPRAVGGFRSAVYGESRLDKCRRLETLLAGWLPDLPGTGSLNALFFQKRFPSLRR